MWCLYQHPLLFTIKSFAVFKVPKVPTEVDEPLNVPKAPLLNYLVSIINGELPPKTDACRLYRKNQ